MTKVVDVRYRAAGKAYRFDARVLAQKDAKESSNPFSRTAFSCRMSSMSDMKKVGSLLLRVQGLGKPSSQQLR